MLVRPATVPEPAVFGDAIRKRPLKSDIFLSNRHVFAHLFKPVNTIDMHYTTCLLAALSFFASSYTLRAQVCSPAESWTVLLNYFNTADEFTVGKEEVRCTDVPDELTVPFFGPIDVDIDVTLTFDGEVAPGWIRAEHADETQLLSSNNQTITLLAGTNRITIIPRQPGTATVSLVQNGGDFVSIPLGTNTFTVVAKPLPVTWTKPLSYRSEDGYIHFSWGVADQRDVAGYTLERQTGDEFIGIHDIPYVENGHDEVIYRTSISAPVTEGYYRIRQTDYAGTYSLSNTVHVPGTEAAGLRLFPNPVSDYVRFSIADKDINRLEVHNVAGRLVRAVDLGTYGNDRISVADLPSGVYLVSAKRSTGRVATQRLVVR